MRVLFDQGTPVPLRGKLKGHVVETAYERGWSNLDNGGLLTAAEANSFDILLTTDSNLQHQQNFSHRAIDAEHALPRRPLRCRYGRLPQDSLTCSSMV